MQFGRWIRVQIPDPQGPPRIKSTDSGDPRTFPLAVTRDSLGFNWNIWMIIGWIAVKHSWSSHQVKIFTGQTCWLLTWSLQRFRRRCRPSGFEEKSQVLFGLTAELRCGYAAEFRNFCGSLTVLVMRPVWELVLFWLCSLIRATSSLLLTLLTGSSTFSLFQKRDVSSLDLSPCHRTSARATRALLSSLTQPCLRTGLYWIRITRRCPPSAMPSMPAFSSSRAWEPREA